MESNMNAKALELYFYMCSHEPIIKWLEELKCKDYEEALQYLAPIAKSNVMSMARNIGQGGNGGSTAGMVNCLNKIEAHFKNKK